MPVFELRIKDLIDEANINIETIHQATIPESPPWQLESPIIIYGLKTAKKVELHVIQQALDVVHNSNKDKYTICVDSLSCLQAIEQQHMDHPLVLDVLEKYSSLINKIVLFCWVPSHVGIRGNELADAAAKAALNERLTIMTLPYSDIKSMVKR